MPLVKCRECRKRVSTEAAACPHCGCPQPAECAGPTDTPGAKPEDELRVVAEPTRGGGQSAGESGEPAAHGAALVPHASPYARSVPGSVEAAVVILLGAAALMAAGITGGWLLVVCAAGLMWGKVDTWWRWRPLTLWLAVLAALMAAGAADQLPSRAEGFVVLGSLLTYPGVMVLVSGERPSSRKVKVGLLCAAAGIASILAGAARVRLGI